MCILPAVTFVKRKFNILLFLYVPLGFASSLYEVHSTISRGLDDTIIFDLVYFFKLQK